MENEHDIAPGQSYEIDLFRPEDAEGVASLFLSVYGAEYPIKTFIDPDVLREENRAGRTISTVARTEKGDIVGHNAVFRNSCWDWTYESGAGLVHRHYRGGHGIFRDLCLHGQEVAAPKMGVQAIFGEPITNHVFALKMVMGLGWPICGLELDLMPAATYAKEKSAPGRVSTFMAFKTLVSRPHRIHIPRVYREQLKYLYAEMDDSREFETAGEALPTAGPASDIRLQYFEFAQVARIALHNVGPDFDRAFEETERTTLEKGVHLVEVFVNLASPHVDGQVDYLREKGYFLGGLLPRWFDDDGLLMQKVMSPPHWDQINVTGEKPVKLVEMVKEEWTAARDKA